MFGVPGLYLRLAAYGAAALLIGGAGYKVGANRWEAKYQGLQAADWESKANREGAARKALEGQLRDAQKTANTNSKVIHDLNTQTVAIAADRDHSVELARRLLASAARPRPGSCSVPEAPDQPATAGTGETASNERLAGLLADAAAECRGNAAQLNALIAEIKPQL